MISSVTHKENIIQKGYCIAKDVFTTEEINNIIASIENADTGNAAFRKTTDLFAIRQFLQVVPQSSQFIFTQRFNAIVNELLGSDYFVVKSIYFDKPEASNWFVAYHQDLTISVNKKIAIDGYGPWSVKQDQYAVQPPLSTLQANFTIRIHLDDTDEYNGALRVIPGSHNKGIYRPETIDWNIEQEDTCAVPAGGIMIMKPLLLHASGRTTNNKKRRVIHIEFSNRQLPEELQWSERKEVNK